MLWLSQEKYKERVLERFNMKNDKPIEIPLGIHFKLYNVICPSMEKDKERLTKIPYSSTVKSLMYAMVYTEPYIAHVVEIVSRFLINPGKNH